MESGVNEKKNFGVVDFVVFVALLVVFLFTGMFIAYKDRKKGSTSNYFFGERKMNPVAVGLSFSVTFLSALTVIGIPAEAYIIGNSQFSAPLAIFFVAIFPIVYFIPAFLRMDIGTVYEYLELRFNPATRRFSSALVTLVSVVNLGINIYLPSLAVSAVTPLPFNLSIALCTVICTVYTALGGMKSVIWTDAIQAVIMIFGMTALFFKTLSVVGGVENLNAALERGERLLLTKPDFDLRSRTSGSSIFLNVLVSFTFIMSFSQPVVQRFQSCKDVRSARWAMAIFVVPTVLIMLLAGGNGCVMYAYFEGCDPVESGKLQSLDQGMPYLALEVFENIPGLAGLFIGAIFSASLSTASSAINSLSVMLVRDFISIKWPHLADRKKLLIGKISAFVVGGNMMIIAYCIPLFKSNIAKLTLSFMGVINGPLLGLFLLGFFCPCASSLGSLIGAAVSFALTFWANMGSMFFATLPPHVPLPPISTEYCPASFLNSTDQYALENALQSSGFNETINEDGRPYSYTFDQMVYSISFVNYTTLSTAITVIVGLVASFITGRNDASRMDPKLFIPIINNAVLPSGIRRFFRFGVPEMKERDREIEMKSKQSRGLRDNLSC